MNEVLSSPPGLGWLNLMSRSGLSKWSFEVALQLCFYMLSYEEPAREPHSAILPYVCGG